MANQIPHEINTSSDPFGLAGLAQAPAPADGWPAIEAALRRRKHVQHGVRWLASAAAVALAVGLYWQFPGIQPGAAGPDGTEQLAAVPGPATEAQSTGSNNNLESLISLSQQLERNLRLVRSEEGAVPAQFVAYQVELEDLVAQIDEAINQRPDSRELWSQRVNLLLDLNQLYRVQLRRDYSHVASL